MPRSVSLALVLACAFACAPAPDNEGGEVEGEGEQIGGGAVGDACAFNSDCGAGRRTVVRVLSARVAAA